MKKIILIVLLSGLCFGLYSNDNPFDISEESSNIEELGFDTVASLEAVKTEAYTMYTDEAWENASKALSDYAKKANLMANIIKAGIEPYYSASYDDRKDYPYSKINVLADYERKVNYYIRERNQAMFDEAVCYIKLDQESAALPLLMKVLDLIDIDNELLWSKARGELYKIIGLE